MSYPVTKVSSVEKQDIKDIPPSPKLTFSIFSFIHLLGYHTPISQPNRKTAVVSLVKEGGGVLIYVSYICMNNSCLQLQLSGHLGSFAYFHFFKKGQSIESRTQDSYIYEF